jgi:APA family basic amino acid/polyamine antiporter
MNKSNAQYRSGDTLVRKLGLFDSTMMMVGIVIGSGIFLTTGIMAKSLPSVSLLLLAWLFGGLLTLNGALIYAELGAAMPEAGGQYVYLREAYGPLAGFLYGWTTFLVYLCGSIAGLAVAFAEYFGYFFPFLSTKTYLISTGNFSLSIGQVVAVVMILLLSGINYIGVAFGKYIQNIFTVIKIGTILVFIVLGFTISSGTPIDFSVNPMNSSLSQLLIGFGIVMVAVFWTFDGWNNVNFIAGEIKNPKKNLPLALIVGTLLISTLYLLVNIIYFKALPVNEMAGTVTIAESSSSVLFGQTTTGFLSAAILISVFGALNGTIFVGSRVYYAMAKDKLFFEKVATVHPRFRTPSFAIIIQAVWASVLALTGKFEQLFTYVIFVAIIFWIGAAASVYTLRKKYPNLSRPYKTWGYPITPAIFILVSLFILITTLFESPVESLTGLSFIVVGIPMFYYWRKKTVIKSE